MSVRKMHYDRQIATRGSRATPLLLFAFALLWTPLAASQSNLGELLDVGAKKLTPEEFKEELVQRVIAGPTPSGGSMEVMYVRTGAIVGQGALGMHEPLRGAPITGEWKTSTDGRICTSMRIAGGTGGSVHGVSLPPRCQYWYKLDQRYFFSDSDSDRSMRVFARTIKP